MSEVRRGQLTELETVLPDYARCGVGRKHSWEHRKEHR